MMAFKNDSLPLRSSLRRTSFARIMWLSAKTRNETL